jgi:DNA polymerase I-like protein with 3'-5' exonuclease and polymerase domains
MEERTSTYRLVTDAEELAGVAETVENAQVVGADIETTALNPRDGKIRLLQLAIPEETFVVDVLEVQDLSPLENALQGGPVKALHNSKFDHAFLWAEQGISLFPIFDTMLAAQLLDGGEYGPSYALEAVAERYLDETVDKTARGEDWSGELSKAQLEYAARDAAILLPLHERLKGALEAEKLGPVSEIEFGAVAAISEMELAGIKLDVARWKELEKTVRERRDEKALELEAQFPPPEGVLPLEGLGPQLNLNSPQQITDAFRTLGIELPDTRVWTLLKVDHPAAKLLLEYRELQKKLGTYLETYAGFIHPKTGRIHANFLQCRVPTGRLACVARGTLVEVARDQSKDFAGVPIERIRAGDLAYTYDEDRRLTLRRVLWAGKTGHKEVLSIKWRSGSHKREGVLEVTPDHEIRLSSGEYIRAENLKSGDRVLALGRDKSSWGYSRIYATAHPGPMREHRFVFEAINGYLPEHVHHADENKLNNLPGNLLGMTNSEHVGHHVNGRMDEAERSRLAEIARNGWGRNRSERLRSLKRGEQSGRWLGLDKEWIEEVLWENAGKPTAFRDVHGIDYATAQKYLKMHGIDWKEIAENFTRQGEPIDQAFYEETRKRMQELGYDAGLEASGISSRRWKKIKAKFETAGVVPNNHEILAVERTGRFVDVYDLEVEDTHNFIAGEICVHNCTNPNIQQIPHEDEFRRCFVAEEGNVLVIADYSQIELRILAEVSDDPGFVRAFQEGEDLHRVTAATMFGVDKGAVTKEQRSAAKRINFGLAYGRGPKSLSAQIGTDEDRARELIDEYFANYPKVQKYLQDAANEAMRTHTLRTLSGRVRKFGNTSGLSSMERGALRREAMNFPVQGAAADIAKLALGYMRRELEDLDARLVNCIHDEFVVECAQEAAPEVSQRMKDAMVRAGEQLLKKVPVEVEVAVSRDWTK